MRRQSGPHGIYTLAGRASKKQVNKFFPLWGKNDRINAKKCQVGGAERAGETSGGTDITEVRSPGKPLLGRGHLSKDLKEGSEE